jgi:hypothetical protein
VEWGTPDTGYRAKLNRIKSNKVGTADYECGHLQVMPVINSNCGTRVESPVKCCEMSVQAESAIYRLMMRIFKACVLALTFVNCTFALAQECPQTNPTGPTVASEVRTLEGRLIFHEGIRRWFELKLDQPQCGETSIELVRGQRDWTPLEVLRGCRVRSKGALDLAATGYYSLDTYQFVDEIESVGTCALQSPFPDYSKARPDKSIRGYRVDMQVNYRPGDHPILFRVSRAGKTLRPWQAYASYFLTGGFVLYGSCGEGFVVDKVFGTPEANPTHFDEPRTSADKAMFDPESAAAAGKKDLHLGYTCVRKR